VAYTVLGGFVVAVCISLPLPQYPGSSDSFQVQLDILDNQGEGEISIQKLTGLHPFADNHGKLYMNEVVLGTAFGVILGPHVLDIFDPRSWTGVTDNLTREIMRVVLGTGLFAIGVELPKKYMAEHAKSLLIMVVPTMAFGWLVSAGESGRSRRENTPLTPASSIHPYPFPQIKFYILPRHCCMLDAYRPNYKRRRYWLVLIVNFSLADH
jgi:hypothetical protein